MNLKKLTALVLALVMALTLFGCGKQQDDVQQNDPQQPETVTVTDMIGREVAVTPGSYQRVVHRRRRPADVQLHCRHRAAVRCGGYRQHHAGGAPQDV